MRDIEVCLAQIGEVRAVATGEQAAYVARSRIARLVLNVARLVCVAVGYPTPDKPEFIMLAAGVYGRTATVARSCNRLYEMSRFISQPSEPLDERWITTWSKMMVELDRLESALLGWKVNSAYRS